MFAREHAELKREMAKLKRQTNARFVRIERILVQVQNAISRLSEAIPDQIGI